MRAPFSRAALCVAILAGCNGKEPEEAPVLALHIAQGNLTQGDRTLSEGLGLIGIANMDDDDEDGVVDFNDTDGVVGENDYSVLEVELPRFSAELTLGGDPATIRVRKGDAVILGGGENGTTTAILADVGQTVTLTVEYGELNSRHTLRVAERASEAEAEEVEGGAPVSFDLPLTGAPLILKHHVQPAIGAYAVNSGSYNAAFIAGYEDALGDRFEGFTGRDYDLDPWLQDEFEFASLSAPDAYMEWIIDSVRNGQGSPGDGLDDVAEDHWQAPDVAVRTPGRDGSVAQSYDYFGNLETSPPVVVDGVEYPFGRVYYGAEGRFAPQQDLRDLLDAQQVQAPFWTTTAWLTVGHIDEFVSTVPAPGTERGWKLVIGDVNAAWEIIEAMDPELELVRWDGDPRRYQGHGIETIGQLVEDEEIRLLNEEIQRDILDPARELFKQELGLTDDDIILMPSLFEETGFGGVAALIPGMANLIVFNAVDETPILFMADPFLRGDISDQSQDDMIAAVEELMPSGVEIVFLDDWFNYHMNLGEVHCGSKVQRTVDVDWWTTAAHLLETE